MSNMTKDLDLIENIVVLRSVYGKVGMKYFIQPCKNPKTGRYPDCVKSVNSAGDMILSDSERNSGAYFVKENETFIVEDGKTYNLNDEVQKAEWEAIQYCPLIVQDRYAVDKDGNRLIDGTMDKHSKKPRYGIAELYIDRPGLESSIRVTKKKLVANATNYILDDERGAEGRLLMARLLGKNMKNFPDADVEDYLLTVAEKSPNKIIDLYTDGDLSLRILFCEAKDRKVITFKNGIYSYHDQVVLGATDDAVLTWMRNAKNKKTLELIKQDTYPENYPIE